MEVIETNTTLKALRLANQVCIDCSVMEGNVSALPIWNECAHSFVSNHIVSLFICL